MAPGDRRYRLRDCEFSSEFTTGVVTRVCPLCLKEDRDGATWPRAAAAPPALEAEPYSYMQTASHSVGKFAGREMG